MKKNVRDKYPIFIFTDVAFFTGVQSRIENRCFKATSAVITKGEKNRKSKADLDLFEEFGHFTNEFFPLNFSIDSTKTCIGVKPNPSHN